ncbi:MAG: imidazolonepropionase [Candidatus Xenobia bacterium]
MDAFVVIAPQIVTCAPGHAPRRGKAMQDVGVLAPGGMVVRSGRIIYAGTPDGARGAVPGAPVTRVNGAVVPGLIDSHTHPVWAGFRLQEFLQRAAGATYQEIQAAGGGISSTVMATRKAPDDELVDRTRDVLSRMLCHGTTTVECKSGYGLLAKEELRQLRILRQVSQDLPIETVPTFLGAHTLPREYREERAQFVSLVTDVMLPQVVSERLAEFCDVFCDEGAFTLAEAERILSAARGGGLGLRIHAEEFAHLGAAQMAARLGAASADHLLALRDEDFPVLREHGIIATLMPGTAFFLRKEYAPARRIMDAEVPLALATDYNAGSCMGLSMQMAMSLGVLQMRMTPEEALVASTVNAAWALRRGERLGSLEAGKDADFLVLEVDDYRQWPYQFGANLVAQVYKRGQLVASRGRGVELKGAAL